ncbi:hypothetical protein N657DRAFT_671389 [Parathielavia appendiculata]|uniref:GED domain-containing protein n=1 Tax=Parathielavia appendiculata TaxID=2587402 RepID=A0AAN6U1T8_9PEZI|nr:hypothetical protein N657DRAFT_671389 [Parathielavia appendiculata]
MTSEANQVDEPIDDLVGEKNERLSGWAYLEPTNPGAAIEVRNRHDHLSTRSIWSSPLVLKPRSGIQTGRFIIWLLRREPLGKVLDALAAHMEPDMDMYSCSMAIDLMEACYKVALKTPVDDVSNLAIERCLLQKPPSILSPEIVCDLTDEEVQRIAAESSKFAA